MASADLDRANAMFAEERYAQALGCCREILARDPGCSEAEHLLGRVLTEAGRAPIASTVLQRVAAQHGDAEVLASLARAQRLAGDPGAAGLTLDEALAMDGSALRARLEVVELLAEVGRLDDAERHARAAIAAHGQTADTHVALADVLAAAGRIEDARAAFAEALCVDPTVARRHVERAMGHESRTDAPRARRALELGARLQPDDPELAHLLGAAGVREPDARASDEYLVHYFDRFAPVFDDQLTELRYQAPEALAAAVDRHVTSLVDILDAGCGTGRCGPLLRPLARSLEGVDISPGMLNRAAALGLYDRLHQSELTAFLRTRPGSYDVLVAADVLIYFGPVDELISSMAGVLRPGGVIAVSIEIGDGPGHTLLPSGRWAHHPEALLEAGRKAGIGFALEEIELRLEYGRPVAGMIAVGRTAASP